MRPAGHLTEGAATGRGASIEFFQSGASCFTSAELRQLRLRQVDGANIDPGRHSLRRPGSTIPIHLVCGFLLLAAANHRAIVRLPQ